MSVSLWARHFVGAISESRRTNSLGSADIAPPLTPTSILGVRQPDNLSSRHEKHLGILRTTRARASMVFGGTPKSPMFQLYLYAVKLRSRFCQLHSQHVRSTRRLDALNESNLPKVRASGDDGDASGVQ